ncbi:winged helix-turn-helix transcriptional regulator [Actinokineospora iranica]|uniref:DNA-binding transcriptional regulator, HxlR family n=1 Tax=Actinokineospora iranica TaxID=1271860 RepID=A0A1G6LTW0_9PSEU|nr:helix-turn-helix domain-containing protein [Actinokineospora iranica]SDC46136.1 DNA-binding transcriptional regulator, HxlR family [Actinokineospora iranica]
MMHPPDRPSVLGAGGDNAIAFAIGVAADEWTLLILRHALQNGTRRVHDWQAVLPVSTAVLTSRLRRMTEVGIFVPVGPGHDPNAVEYHLSRRGTALWPIIVSIWAWEATWADGQAERLPAMRHRGCGELFAPLLGCGTCGRPVPPREVTGEFGPSGSWPRTAPNTTMRRRSSGSASLGPGFFPQSRALIGNRWSAAMLGAAYLGARRFSEFQRRLSAPATVIADRLRTFRDLGVLEVSGDPDRSDRSTYRLTDKGRAFFPVVMSAIEWGQRWFLAPEGPALVFHHRGADHAFSVLLLCSACSAPLAGREIEAV